MDESMRDVYYRNILHNACIIDSTDILKASLKHDSFSDINIEYCGEPLLHTACTYNSINVVKYLLSLPCDVNKQDSMGNTALHLTRDLNTIVYLMQHGAKASITNSQGETAFDGKNPNVQRVMHLMENKNRILALRDKSLKQYKELEEQCYTLCRKIKDDVDDKKAKFDSIISKYEEIIDSIL